MSYIVTNVIAINFIEVEPLDMNDFKRRVSQIVQSMRDTEYDPPIADDPSHCISQELTANKGSCVVIAGQFNYWIFPKATEFARRLHQEFKAAVVLTSWDETGEIHCVTFEWYHRAGYGEETVRL